MVLIVYYVVFMIAGDFAAYFLGLIVEKTFGGGSKPLGFPHVVFLVPLVCLAACGVDDGTEAGVANTGVSRADETLDTRVFILTSPLSGSFQGEVAEAAQARPMTRCSKAPIQRSTSGRLSWAVASVGC